MPDSLAAAVGCLGAWTVVLFVAGALYATINVGLTGGPNHGEHPFLVAVLHVILFFVVARGWPPGTWWAYLGLLALTLAYSVVAMGFVGASATRLWIGRGIMAALYAGMFLVAWKGA